MATNADNGVQAIYALMRRHTKHQLLTMAYDLGLVGGAHPPEKWTKQELAETVRDLKNRRTSTG